MPGVVYRMMTLLCTLVGAVPIGTNLGLLHLLWMLASGRLLASRGAVIPGLSDCGLSARAIRRAWAALGQGDWTGAALLDRWAALLGAEGHWQAHTHGGYCPGAGGPTRVWPPRPRARPAAPHPRPAGRP